MIGEDTLIAALLGVLEGLTEFIPVSSTGHLLLAGHFLGFETPGRTFEVVIQLGAILALLAVYAARLLDLFTRAPHDPGARRFIMGVLLAFLPAVVVGVLAHGFIKRVLFESPMLIAIMLVLGGVVLLFVDRMAPRPSYTQAEDLPLHKAFLIGIFQLLAMVPGVSRSGATIVGGLLLGADKRTAAEFSFFLSMPTMTGAVAFDLWKSRAFLDFAAVSQIAVGFVAAFIAAVIVVRWLLDYVGRRGYALFGWWRIAIGLVAIIALTA